MCDLYRSLCFPKAPSVKNRLIHKITFSYLLNILIIHMFVHIHVQTDYVKDTPYILLHG